MINKNAALAGCIAALIMPGIFYAFVCCPPAPVFASPQPRQPILSEPEKASVKGAKDKIYENGFYGFSLSYPAGYDLSAKRGGAVTVTPQKITGYRFVPALVVCKYFIIKDRPLADIVAQIEKKMSALPYYRLNYISYGSKTSEVKICREFVDYISEETVYEVSLYKVKSEDLFEISWQVPRPHSNSAIALDFERTAASFKILQRQGTAEVMTGAPVDSPAHILKGANSLMALGRYLEAVVLLKKAAETAPVNADIFLLTAKCYTALKDYKRAAAEYDKLLKIQPAGLEFLNLFVDSLIMCRDYKKALSYSGKALKISGPPDAMAMAYINLGNIFLETNMLNESLNSYKEGIAKFPSNARLYNNAAFVYYMQRDYISSADYYNKAIFLDGDYKTAHLGIAAIYMQKSDYTSAAFHYNKVIKLDDECEEAYAGLLKIYGAMKMRPKYDELVKLLNMKGPGFYDRVVKKAR
jgi:tetratricopeptide (TPR) repeat protein